MFAVALVPTRVGFEQLSRAFVGVDFQAWLPTVDAVSPAVVSGAVNFARTRVVLVADTYPHGGVWGESSTRLVQALANVLVPPNSADRPIPLLVVRTDPADNGADAPGSDGHVRVVSRAELLVEAVRQAVAARAGQEAAGDAMARVRVVAGDLDAIHAGLVGLLGDQAPPRPAAPLLLTASGDLDAAGHIAPVITVTSSKGGAGKTTTSLMLAFTAAHLGARAGRRMNVVVVELDLARAVMGSLLPAGSLPPVTRTILDYANRGEASEVALLDCLTEVPVTDGVGSRLVPELGLRFLLGPRHAVDAPNLTPQHVSEVIGLLARSDEVDLVLVDTGADILEAPHLQAAFAVSDQVVYLLEDKPTSYVRLRESLLFLQQDAGVDPAAIKLVVNKSGRGVASAGLRADIMAHADGVVPLGVVPHSPWLTTFDGVESPGLWSGLFVPSEAPLAAAYAAIISALSPLDDGNTLMAVPAPPRRRWWRR